MDRVSEKQLFWIGSSAVAVLLAIFALPALDGRIYVHTDLRHFHFPLRYFYWECLQLGQRFTWFPYEFGGLYLHGEGQLGLFHPLNLLQYRLLPFIVAFDLEVMRGYVFMAAGTYFLGRRWGLRKDASLLCAVFFAFSGFNFRHFMHVNMVGIAAHVPWVALAIDVLANSARRRSRALAAVAVTLLVASQLSVGHPPTAWLSFVGEGAVAAYILAPRLISGAQPSVRRAALVAALSLALAVLLGCAIAAHQLVPQWETLASSHRADTGEGFADTYALRPLALAFVVSPYLMRSDATAMLPYFTHTYMGCVVPALLVWLLMRRGAVGPSWRLGRAALVLLVVCITLAMGKSGLLYRIQTALPVVGMFRAPARYLLLGHFAAAVAAAVAYEDLSRVSEGGGSWGLRRLWPLALLPLACLVISGWGLWQNRVPGEPSATLLTSPTVLVAGAVPCLAAAAAVLFSARGSQLARVILVLLAVADLGTFGLVYITSDPPLTPTEMLADAPVEMQGSPLRINNGPPAWTARQIRLASGYVAMTPNRTLPVGKQQVAILGAGHALVPSFRVAGVVEAYGRPVLRPLPRARLVTAALRSDDVLEDIARIDVARTALVSEELKLGDGPPGRARIVVDDPGEISVEVRSETRQLLIVNERYHEGWRASVDGEPCRVVRVYADFMGCVVPAGAGRVDFAFEPASLKLGVCISAFGLVATCLWMLAWIRMPRRRCHRNQSLL